MERSDLCVIFVAGEEIHDTVVKIRYRNFRGVGRSNIEDGQVAMRECGQGPCGLDQG